MLERSEAWAFLWSLHFAQQLCLCLPGKKKKISPPGPNSSFQLLPNCRQEPKEGFYVGLCDISLLQPSLLPRQEEVSSEKGNETGTWLLVQESYFTHYYLKILFLLKKLNFIMSFIGH